MALVALAFIPVSIGMLAFVIDLGNARVVQQKLQIAADAAALAGADAIGSQSLDPKSIATGYINTNLASISASTQTPSITLTCDSSLTNLDCLYSKAYSGQYFNCTTQNYCNEIVVRETASFNTIFARYFGLKSINVSVTAKAAPNRTNFACLLALANTGTSLTFAASGVVFTGCGIQVNSSDQNALNLYPASVKADFVNIVGNYIKNCIIFCGTFNNTPVKTGAGPLGDPYDSLYASNGVDSAHTHTCDHNSVDVQSSTTLQPGTYCGGLTIEATTTLAPGEYTIKGGTLNFTGGVVTNQPGGVTFILTNNPQATPSSTAGACAKFSFFGSSVTLAAPATGKWAGILIYQDKICSSSPGSEFTAGINNLTGAIYLPTEPLTFTFTLNESNTSTNLHCAPIAAYNISIYLSFTADTNCGGTGVTPLSVSARTRLVG